jgi:hypothetical protein
MIKFEGVGGSAVWTAGKLVGPDPLTAVVDALVRDHAKVGFDYWAPVEASLDSPWTAYLTVGSAWVSVYNDSPRVMFPPENPDGYSPEGPVDATMEAR